MIHFSSIDYSLAQPQIQSIPKAVRCSWLLAQFFPEGGVNKSKAIRELNWTELIPAESRVLYIGETHPNIHVRPALARALPQLAMAGVTHLGIEMLTAKNQRILDDFSARTSGSDKELLEALRNEWGWDINSYFDMLVVARELGLRLVALDLNRSPGKESNPQSDRQRDIAMANRISEVLDSMPTAKIVVLAGSEHARRDRQPAILAQFYGIASVSYNIIDNNDSVYSSLQSQGLTTRQVLAPSTSFKFDGLISLPMGPFQEGWLPNYFPISNLNKIK